MKQKFFKKLFGEGKEVHWIEESWRLRSMAGQASGILGARIPGQSLESHTLLPPTLLLLAYWVLSIIEISKPTLRNKN